MSPEQERLKKIGADLERLRGARDVVTKRVATYEERHTHWVKETSISQMVLEVLQAASETRREDLRVRVESLVTRGLRAVFGRSDIEFFLRTVFSRDVMAVHPMIRSRFGTRELETEVVEGHGGGIADVVSFVLRVVVLCLGRPRPAPVLVLDEPFRHVSPEHLRGCASLLRELNREVGIQFILVTHKTELTDAADVVYRTRQDPTTDRTEFVTEQDMRDDDAHQAIGARKARERATILDASPDPTKAILKEDCELVDGLVDDPRARAQRAQGGVNAKLAGGRVWDLKPSGQDNKNKRYERRKKAEAVAEDEASPGP